VRNTFHPRVVKNVLCVWVSDLELEPISRIEKHFVVKLLTVGINAGDNNEYYTGGMLLGLLEEIAHSGGANSHKHFYEIAAAN
jgi:hypothetical protein